MAPLDAKQPCLVAEACLYVSLRCYFVAAREYSCKFCIPNHQTECKNRVYKKNVIAVTYDLGQFRIMCCR